jgi:hypothetical protein
MAMDDEGVPAYAPEIFHAQEAEDGPKKVLGRKLSIEDGRLWGQRDSLVFLVETSWPEIGGKLARIKTISDVYDVLKVWEEQNRHNTNSVAQTLLRKSTTPATANELNERRRRGGEMHVACLASDQVRDKCRTALETAQRALSPDLSETDRATVEEQIAKRTQKLAKAEAELESAQARDHDAQELIEKSETYFARAEFAQFCRSKRYRLTPLNVANALAGLPYVGCRQSILRCQRQTPSGANGGAIQEFSAIEKIIRSGTRRSELIRHAEQWLKSTQNSKSHVVSELRKNWYYLEKAIQAALEARIRTDDLPFEITKDYRRRKSQPSNIDILFAEEEAL